VRRRLHAFPCLVVTSPHVQYSTVYPRVQWNSNQSCPWPLPKVARNREPWQQTPTYPRVFQATPPRLVLSSSADLPSSCRALQLCFTRRSNCFHNTGRRYLYSMLASQLIRMSCTLRVPPSPLRKYEYTVQILGFTMYIRAQQRGQLQVQIFITCPIYGNTSTPYYPANYGPHPNRSVNLANSLFATLSRLGSTLPPGSGRKLGTFLCTRRMRETSNPIPREVRSTGRGGDPEERLSAPSLEKGGVLASR
jgi:hypothetical protein